MIKPLTSLRFAAALLVVAHHYFQFTPGYAGVSFFFVLSGYVLTINYVDRVATSAERAAFWWRRVARIYPLHLLTLAAVLTKGVDWASLPYQLTLTQAFVPSQAIYFSYNPVSWSISDEAFFYLVFPWLLIWMRDDPKQRLQMLGVIVVFAALIFTILNWQDLEADPTHWFFYIFPPVRLIEFAAGIALALRPPLQGAGFRHEIGALTLAAICLGLAVLDLPGAFASAMIFWPAAMAMVIVFSCSNGPIARLLSHRVLVVLGEASFALYMIHLKLLGLSPLPLFLTAGLAIAASVALHFYFELPMQQLLLRPLRRWQRLGSGTATQSRITGSQPQL